MSKKICIIGAGGFAREVLCLLKDLKKYEDVFAFMESEQFYKKRKIMAKPVLPLSDFDSNSHTAVIAIGDPYIRENIVKSMPDDTEFKTVIHPTAVVSDWVEVGEGCIICAGSVITCNVKIGKHSHINLLSTIGHDCQLEEFVTVSPGVNISGKCFIGKKVYLGTSCSIREKLRIYDEVVVGMGVVVVKDITEKGIFVGNPAKRLSKLS